MGCASLGRILLAVALQQHFWVDVTDSTEADRGYFVRGCHLCEYPDA